MSEETNAEYVAAFLTHIRPVLATSTLYHKQWQLGHFIAHVEKKKKRLAALAAVDIEAYLLKANRWRHSTRCDNLAAIRDFYTFLKQQYPSNFPRNNPTHGIHIKRRLKRKVVLVPGHEQIQTTLAAMSGRDNIRARRNRAMAELAYGSGLRRGELAALDIEDVDFEKKQVYVRGKGGHRRMVPVTAIALTTIRQYLDNRGVASGPLFVGGRGKRLRSGAVGWLFRNKVGFRPHLLRHACATHMLINGCDTRLIQEILGHKHLTTTQVYTHIIPVDLERALRTLHPRAQKLN